MHQRLPKTVLLELKRHGHCEPALSCRHCRDVLTEHAQREVVIPTLRAIAKRHQKPLDHIMEVLSKASIANRKKAP
jgi:cytidine deaminase